MTTEDKDLLESAKQVYKDLEDWWADNRKKWLEDASFRLVGEGNQWPEEIKKERLAARLPCLEVDKLNQYVRQVVNDGRQNRPAVKVRPVDDDGDPEVAEALQGLIRHICDRSNADEAFDTALDHAAGCGFGFFRVLTEYAHEKTFNQELVVRRVPDAMTVLLGRHQLADGSDAKVAFVLDDIEKDEYKRRHPNAKATNWSDPAFQNGWSTDKTVRIAEYWYKVEELTNLHLLTDGTTATQQEYEAAAGAGLEVPEIKETRQIPVCKVKWCRMSGAEILEKRDWLGKYIPIIPVYGNESNIEGKIVYSGLIRAAKDPQRLYNFSRSAFAQRVALTPKAPWLAPKEATEGHEDEWSVGSVGTRAVLPYNSVTADGQPIPPPQRINPTDVPAGFAQDMEIAEHDIQASMGMYSASLGEKSNEKSGKAIMARQREGDTATFHYQDNLNRAIRYLGRILVDAAPKYYDSRRVVRMLGEDGTPTMAQIDPEMQKAVQRQGSEVIYNLNVGTYDVSVAAGPSYTTRRQEAAEAMIELTRANPTMWQTHGDLIAKSQDWHNADEFAKRSKLALPPDMRQAVEAEEEDSDTSPEMRAMQAQMQQVVQQAKDAIAEREELLAQASEQIKTLEQQLKNKDAEAEAKLQDSDTKFYEAQTERIQAMAPAITPELIQQIAQATAEAVLTKVVETKPPDPMPLADTPPPGGFFTPEGM
jgi:hypothetical protein